MATFGKTTIGATAYGWGENTMFGSKFTCPEAGVLTSVSVYISEQVENTPVKVAVYKDAAGAPGALVASSGEIVVSSTPKWVDFLLNGGIVAGDYWLVILCGTPAAWYRYDAGAPGQFVLKVQSYAGGFPDPFGPFTYGLINQAMSIYATYIPSPTTGSLIVQSTPSGASVVINGQPPRTAPFTIDLSPGTYTLTVTYQTQNQSRIVQITAGGSSSEIFTFTVTESLLISSTPSGIEFTLNGSREKTPFGPRNVEIGTYKIVMPPSITIGSDIYSFFQWEDGSTNRTRIITLTGSPQLTLTATYKLPATIEGTGPINQRQHKDNLREVFGGGEDLSEDNPLPTAETVPTAILNGQVTIAAPSVPLAGAVTPIKSVTIENPIANAVVYVGNDTVTAADGYRLQPGATVSMDIDDLNKVYITGTAGNVVSYIAVN